MRKVYFNILTKGQARVFPKLGFVKEKGFYLAGGTGLALQLGHRTSVDFDFYSQSHFDAPQFYQEIEKEFGRHAEKIAEEKDTLFCSICGVDASFFWYKYPLIHRVKTISGISVASLADIAAMKLIAISHRPVKRDYIDIFFLLQVFSLEEMFSFIKKKYPNFNPYFSMRALGFFEDIEDIKERSERPIKVFDKDFSWERAEKEIFEEVRRYQLSMIKT